MSEKDHDWAISVLNNVRYSAFSEVCNLDKEAIAEVQQYLEEESNEK